MRFRSRSAPVSIQEVPVRCYYTNDTLFYEGTNTCISTNYGESIVDDATKEFRRRKVGSPILRAKPTTHTRWSYEPDYSLIRETREPGNWYAYQSGIGQICDVLLENPPTDIGLWLSSVLLSAVTDPFTGHYERWNKVRPTTATRANLSVFLYELSDIKRMFDIIPKRHLSYKRRSIREWKDVLPHIEVANGIHLNYNFGWKPFFAEIYNVAKAVDNHKARLNKFLFSQNRELRQHVSDADGTGIISRVITTLYPAEWEIRVTGSYTSRLSSTFAYEYLLPAYGEKEMQLRSWLDALGLNVTPANLWAVIPWSFVVDWFVDIGGMLRKHSTDWITPYLTWYESCASVKYVAKANVTAYRKPTGVTYPSGSIYFKHYSRRLGLPDLSVETPGSLDADKIRLLASLLVQQVL